MRWGRQVSAFRATSARARRLAQRLSRSDQRSRVLQRRSGGLPRAHGPEPGHFGPDRASQLRGTVQISKDRKLIDELWSEAWKLWFPEGKDDPTRRILIFDTQSGEYCDNTSHRGLRFAIEAATAYIQGREAEMVEDQNAKVKL